jgi:hypothetical protein
MDIAKKDRRNGIRQGLQSRMSEYGHLQAGCNQIVNNVIKQRERERVKCVFPGLRTIDGWNRIRDVSEYWGLFDFSALFLFNCTCMGNLEDQQSACHVAKIITCLAEVSHYLFAWLKRRKAKTRRKLYHRAKYQMSKEGQEGKYGELCVGLYRGQSAICLA